MKEIVAILSILFSLAGCAYTRAWLHLPEGTQDNSVGPPPADMKNEPHDSLGYNCYYNHKCPNYLWGAAHDAQHNNNYAIEQKQAAEAQQAAEQNRRDLATKQRIEEDVRQREEREQQESKYKMKFCSQPISHMAELNGNELESKCLYIITNLKIIQVLKDGVLVRHEISGKVFFMKTKKQYVDDDRISVIANYTGIKKYMSAIGAEKTVTAFNYLGDY